MSTSNTGSVNVFLVVGFALLILMLFIINLYTVARYQHPDDKNESIFAKIVILLGLNLSTLAILLIPVDVGNNEGNPNCDYKSGNGTTFCGGINMRNVYESLFCMVWFIIICLVPFTTFYYDSASVDGINKGRFKTALYYDLVVVIAFLVIILPLYYTFPDTNIPVSTYDTDVLELVKYTYTSTSGTPYDFIQLELPASAFSNLLKSTITSYVSFSVTFPLYLIGICGWVGWWLFSVFVGVGLVALPFDLILAYIYRPRVLAPDVLGQKELELQERTNELLDIAVLLKKDHQNFINSSATRREKQKRVITDRLEINRLTQMVYVLQKDTEELQACKHIYHDYNPLVPYAKLVVGSIFGAVSTLWILQIILYMLTKVPITYFLNTFLISFDLFFPMFGNISYGLLSLYLLFCCLLGCFKVGLRFLCIKIHPMEVNATYVDAFLFNLAIILVTTVPLVQFCTIALGGYSRYTDAFLIFGVEIQYLHFFTKFYENSVFEYFILITAFITFVYLLRQPREKSMSPEDFKKNLQNRQTYGNNYRSVNSDNVHLEISSIYK